MGHCLISESCSSYLSIFENTCRLRPYDLRWRSAKRRQVGLHKSDSCNSLYKPGIARICDTEVLILFPFSWLQQSQRMNRPFSGYMLPSHSPRPPFVRRHTLGPPLNKWQQLFYAAQALTEVHNNSQLFRRRYSYHVAFTFMIPSINKNLWLFCR
jgi:hypothetical protein